MDADRERPRRGYTQAESDKKTIAKWSSETCGYVVRKPEIEEIEYNDAILNEEFWASRAAQTRDNTCSWTSLFMDPTWILARWETGALIIPSETRYSCRLWTHDDGGERESASQYLTTDQSSSDAASLGEKLRWSVSWAVWREVRDQCCAPSGASTSPSQITSPERHRGRRSSTMSCKLTGLD